MFKKLAFGVTADGNRAGVAVVIRLWKIEIALEALQVGALILQQ